MSVGFLQGDIKQWDVETHETSHCFKKNIAWPCHINDVNDLLNPNQWQNHYQAFACVYFDEATKDVVLIRDHLGLQPLYFCYQPHQCIIAETLPGVIKHLAKHPSLNKSQVENIFSTINFYSDETIYQNIFRVEPGHIIHINGAGKITKKAFWHLESKGDFLHYKTDEEYVEQFAAILDEAIQNATTTAGNASLAAEFSAGMDSSAIYCAVFNRGLQPALFMHTALPGTDAAQRYQDHYEAYFIKHFQVTDLTRIGSENFDPLTISQHYAKLFAGCPPHIFYMFANNLHQAVAAKNHSILLSGFGGDQGVSGHTPIHHLLPFYIKNHGYKATWSKLLATSQADTKNAKMLLHQLYVLGKYSHPFLHHLLPKNKRYTHPYFSSYFSSLREAEWYFLQGPGSYEIRMRIEYSAIAAKSLGFEYRYPLLYPKLLEFYLQIPPEQKRHNGRGRYLMRRYLAKQLPAKIFDAYKKCDGLDIMPAAMSLFEAQFASGLYKEAFTDLPYAHLIPRDTSLRTKINHVFAYMLKYYLNSLY